MRFSTATRPPAFTAILILALLATSALALTGCGGGGTKQADAPGPSATMPQADGRDDHEGSSLTIVIRPDVPDAASGSDEAEVAAEPDEPVLSPGKAYDRVEVTPVPVETVAIGLQPGSLAGARLAIIIDDLGGGVAGTSELMQVRAPLTVAIMPGGRHAESEALAAADSGFAVILHQPMEALDSSKDPGPGAITAEMPETEIRTTIEDNLTRVPGAIGVNNHMGSKVTEDSVVVEIVLSEVFSRGLIFIDSRTSSKSVVAQVAAAMGASVLENSTFLDGVNTEDYVIEQIRSAAKKAHSRGSAVAIGHVRPATVRALQRMLPELDASGLTLVTVDKLAHRQEELQ